MCLYCRAVLYGSAIKMILRECFAPRGKIRAGYDNVQTHARACMTTCTAIDK